MCYNKSIAVMQLCAGILHKTLTVILAWCHLNYDNIIDFFHIMAPPLNEKFDPKKKYSSWKLWGFFIMSVFKPQLLEFSYFFKSML